MPKPKPPMTEEAVEMAQVLYSMQLGEMIQINGDRTIYRVPGGWIFRCVAHHKEPAGHRTHDPAGVTTCFVPFSDEFDV